jgi:hypothetical protein
MEELKKNAILLKKQYDEVNGILKIINRPLNTEAAPPAAQAKAG